MVTLSPALCIGGAAELIGMAGRGGPFTLENIDQLSAEVLACLFLNAGDHDRRHRVSRIPEGAITICATARAI